MAVSVSTFIITGYLIHKEMETSALSKNKPRMSTTLKEKLEIIIDEAIKDYQKDQKKYKDIMDLEVLEEYQENPATFKSTVLRNECPAIQKTLANKKAKQLDKYRINFNAAKPTDLLNVVTKLCQFAENYVKNTYSRSAYEMVTDVADLKLDALDTEEGYTAWGVIGGSIKTILLYKIYPEQFPSRSQNALWAL